MIAINRGVDVRRSGFGIVEEQPDIAVQGSLVAFEGQDVVAALFDDPNAVSFVPLSAQQRFTALQSGEVDVLIRNTTWTVSRDTAWGLFAPTTFYDGQAIMVYADVGAETLEDLAGDCNYSGFLEVAPLAGSAPDSEIGRLFVDLSRDDDRVGAYRVSGTDDIWNAVRHFFTNASQGA